MSFYACFPSFSSLPFLSLPPTPLLPSSSPLFFLPGFFSQLLLSFLSPLSLPLLYFLFRTSFRCPSLPPTLSLFRYLFVLPPSHLLTIIFLNLAVVIPSKYFWSYIFCFLMIPYCEYKSTSTRKPLQLLLIEVPGHDSNL